MKKELKGFIFGVAVTSILSFSFSGLAETAWKNINVAVNSINLKVNGKAITTDNFIYDGTTYVPLRAVGEMLGKDVVWDDVTRTAQVNDKDYVEPKVESKPIQNKNDNSLQYYSWDEPISFIDYDNNYNFTEIKPNIIGTPELKLSAVNCTNKDIVAFEFQCKFLDQFDRLVYKTGTSDSIFYGIVQDANLPKSNGESNYMTNRQGYTFNLALYNLAYKLDQFDPNIYGEIKLTKVKFSDGTVWDAK